VKSLAEQDCDFDGLAEDEDEEEDFYDDYELGMQGTRCSCHQADSVTKDFGMTQMKEKTNLICKTLTPVRHSPPLIRSGLSDPVYFRLLDVFYSKDRVEDIVEVEEQPVKGRLKVPDGMGRACYQNYTVFTKGQWMAGCPEMGKCW
jgi:hypothetical protein